MCRQPTYQRQKFIFSEPFPSHLYPSLNLSWRTAAQISLKMRTSKASYLLPGHLCELGICLLPRHLLPRLGGMSVSLGRLWGASHWNMIKRRVCNFVNVQKLQMQWIKIPPGGKMAKPRSSSRSCVSSGSVDKVGNCMHNKYKQVQVHQSGGLMNSNPRWCMKDVLASSNASHFSVVEMQFVASLEADHYPRQTLDSEQ